VLADPFLFVPNFLSASKSDHFIRSNVFTCPSFCVNRVITVHIRIFFLSVYIRIE